MQTGNPDVSFKVLHEALVTAGRATEIGKAAQISIASAVAAICTAAGPEQVALTVQSLLHEVRYALNCLCYPLPPPLKTPGGLRCA